MLYITNKHVTPTQYYFTTTLWAFSFHFIVILLGPFSPDPHFPYVTFMCQISSFNFIISHTWLVGKFNTHFLSLFTRIHTWINSSLFIHIGPCYYSNRHVWIIMICRQLNWYKFNVHFNDMLLLWWFTTLITLYTGVLEMEDAEFLLYIMTKMKDKKKCEKRLGIQ